jgi:hypothetical protein
MTGYGRVLLTHSRGHFNFVQNINVADHFMRSRGIGMEIERTGYERIGRMGLIQSPTFTSKEMG